MVISHFHTIGTLGLWFAPSFNLGSNLAQLFTYNDGIYVRWLGKLLEAARIDGASEFRTFTIALYLMIPALVTIFLFQFVAIWNNYFLPLVMLSD